MAAQQTIEHLLDHNGIQLDEFGKGGYHLFLQETRKRRVVGFRPESLATARIAAGNGMATLRRPRVEMGGLRLRTQRAHRLDMRSRNRDATNADEGNPPLTAR